MNKMKKTLCAAIIISAAGLSGCASTESTQQNVHNTNDVVVMDEAALAIQKIKALAEHVEQQYQAAKEQNYVYFAPDSWGDVNSDVRTMRTLVARFDPNDQGFFGGPSESKVIDKIEEAQAALDKAVRIKQLVSVFLAQQLADIEYLSPQVHGQWQNALNDINESTADLIADIEDDDSTDGYEKRSTAVQARLLQLEIRIVKSNYYTPLVKKMKKMDQNLIPQTYAQIQQSVQQLNDAIVLAPRKQHIIENIVTKVEDDLRRANNVTTEVKWINSVDRSDGEKIALRYRDAIATVAFNLFSEDISSLTYVEQITYFNDALHNKLEQQQARNDEQAQLIITLTEKVKTALTETDIVTNNAVIIDSDIITKTAAE
ncbi:ATPase involved in DNA repair [Moritella sp. JT01]|nr:ATPase involved in DNA repair [Moritella sp. JT01]